MSSNRLIVLLKRNFTDLTIAKKCRDSSKIKIEQNDCSRIFDEFPIKLFDEHDPLLEKFVNKLNIIFSQIHENAVHGEEIYPINENIDRWITQIAKLGRTELLDSDNYIKIEIIDLLGWNKLCLQIDTRQLLCAYISMALPQIIQCSLKSFKSCPPEYTAFVLNRASNCDHCIARALSDDDNDSSLILPIGIAAASALVTGLLITWSLFSQKRVTPEVSAKKQPEVKKAGNY